VQQGGYASGGAYGCSRQGFVRQPIPGLARTGTTTPARQRLAITAECLPPRGADGSAVKQLVAALPKAIRAPVVAENHEEVRACALACAALLLGEKVEPILPLVARDRNRIPLQSDALGAAVLGVANVLCLSGEHQTLGVSPQAAGAFDVDPPQLLQALKAMRDEGVLLGGERLGPPPAFFLGAVAHPCLRPMKLNLLQTGKKVAAGAQFLLTQPVWDIAGFAEWMSAVRDAGLPELAAEAKDLQGIRGIHILSAGREEAVAPIIEASGLGQG